MGTNTDMLDALTRALEALPEPVMLPHLGKPIDSNAIPELGSKGLTRAWWTYDFTSNNQHYRIFLTRFTGRLAGGYPYGISVNTVKPNGRPTGRQKSVFHKNGSNALELIEAALSFLQS